MICNNYDFVSQQQFSKLSRFLIILSQIIFWNFRAGFIFHSEFSWKSVQSFERGRWKIWIFQVTPRKCLFAFKTPDKFTKFCECVKRAIFYFYLFYFLSSPLSSTVFFVYIFLRFFMHFIIFKKSFYF